MDEADAVGLHPYKMKKNSGAVDAGNPRRGPGQRTASDWFHTRGVKKKGRVFGGTREIKRLLFAPCRLLLRRQDVFQVGGPMPIWPVERKDTLGARNRGCGRCGRG
jgi:hypothetical protein